MELGVFLVGADEAEQHVAIPLLHFVPGVLHVHGQPVVVVLVGLPVLHVDLQFHRVALLHFEVLHVDLLPAHALRHEFVAAVPQVDGDVRGEGRRELREHHCELELVLGGDFVAAFVGLFEFQLLPQDDHVLEVYLLDLQEREDVAEEFEVYQQALLVLQKRGVVHARSDFVFVAAEFVLVVLPVPIVVPDLLVGGLLKQLYQHQTVRLMLIFALVVLQFHRLLYPEDQISRYVCAAYLLRVLSHLRNTVQGSPCCFFLRVDLLLGASLLIALLLESFHHAPRSVFVDVGHEFSEGGLNGERATEFDNVAVSVVDVEYVLIAAVDFGVGLLDERHIGVPLIGY